MLLAARFGAALLLFWWTSVVIAVAPKLISWLITLRDFIYYNTTCWMQRTNVIKIETIAWYIAETIAIAIASRRFWLLVFAKLTWADSESNGIWRCCMSILLFETSLNRLVFKILMEILHFNDIEWPPYYAARRILDIFIDIESFVNQNQNKK